MALLQPSYIVEYRVGSLFDAAMIAVDRLMTADLCILKAVSFLLCSERRDILVKRALIALEGQNVVGLLLQYLEEVGHGYVFVGFLRHFDLAQHEALARREGGNHMDRRFRTLLLERSSGSLAINGDDVSRRAG